MLHRARICFKEEQAMTDTLVDRLLAAVSPSREHTAVVVRAMYQHRMNELCLSRGSGRRAI